jgi:hypothetical protein
MRATLLGLALLLVALALPAVAPAATLRFFHSPSGNIDCLVSSYQARCDIRSHTFTSPPKPARCDLDWGQSIAVGKASRRGGFACIGDTVRDPTGKAKALAYGRTLHAGTLHCTSQTAGMRCANARGHGFLVGRASYRLF